jgi:hypothetical protein
VVGNDKAQYCVAEELETLVGRQPTPLGAVGTVGERLAQQVCVDGVLAESPAQLSALRLRLGLGIVQAASTFALT